MKKAYSYIRFSTPEQLKGDSLRRQKEASDQYCKDKGLMLDTSLNMRDLGKSAFHGTHVSKGGALYEFLQLVEAGKIEKGSVLIVENLDRLSREKVLVALNQFTNIIQAGITIVTLQDKQEYTQENVNDNWAQLIISITYMARAHDESLRKSQRLSSAWKQKRKNAISTDNKKLTKMAPAWLRLSNNRKQFVLIPEICEAIESIYRMKLAGKGARYIETEINKMSDIWKPPITTRNKSGGWRKSYINKLLMNNRELIGEYQPHRMIEGKRIPEGEPIIDYFPSVFPDKELFYSVQALINNNSKTNGRAGGQTGKASNLFTHIVRCGLCGGVMHLIDKGNSPKGGKLLHCDKSRRNQGCEAKPVHYDEFERLFFADFDELDLSEFVSGQDELKTEISALNRSIGVGTYRIEEIDKKMNNLVADREDADSPELRQALDKRYKELVEENKALTSQVNAEVIQLKELQNNDETFKQGIYQANEIYILLNTATDEKDKIEIRLRLREQIRRVCKTIQIWPLQEKYIPMQETDEPGMIIHMASKYIDKIRITFNGSKKVEWLYLKRSGEMEQ
jgi:DNA invertase Pin-like site-specific DNA recombinase